MIKLQDLKFGADGLIPAVVTDYYSKKVLTVAYMNIDSLNKSIECGRTCFYSRSRKELWLKGEKSGNYQHIVSIKADCDRDALAVEVVKDGPACHTGSDSCFDGEYLYLSGIKKEFSLSQLYGLIKSRKEEMPEGSYTTYLFEKGLDKILKKVGEECTEVIIGAKNDKKEMVYEIADLAYHILVLMNHENVPLWEVIDELAARHIIDKKAKQEKMV